MPAKTTAKGHGLKRKVMGLPVWAWGAVIIGGVLIGVYMRRKAAASSTSSTDTQAAQDTGQGAGATPSDNGLGSSSTDLQGFLDAQGQLLDQFGSGLQDLITSSQMGANWGGGGFGDTSGGDTTSGDSTGTVDAGVTLGLGNTGDLNLNALTPATLRQAWASYYAAQRRQGIHTQTTVSRPSPAGTTQRVAGGAFTQVSGAARTTVRKVKAIFVPAKGGQRAHWALPGSGRWVSGPGYY